MGHFNDSVTHQTLTWVTGSLSSVCYIFAGVHTDLKTTSIVESSKDTNFKASWKQVQCSYPLYSYTDSGLILHWSVGKVIMMFKPLKRFACF